MFFWFFSPRVLHICTGIIVPSGDQHMSTPHNWSTWSNINYLSLNACLYGYLSALAPPTPCDMDNGGCQQECSFMDDVLSCTCFDNYVPVGDGSVCRGKYICVCRETHAFLLLRPHLAITFAVSFFPAGVTAVITDSMSTSSNYTACSLLSAASENEKFLEILNSGNTSLTSSKAWLKLLALVFTDSNRYVTALVRLKNHFAIFDNVIETSWISGFCYNGSSYLCLLPRTPAHSCPRALTLIWYFRSRGSNNSYAGWLIYELIGLPQGHLRPA